MQKAFPVLLIVVLVAAAAGWAAEPPREKHEWSGKTGSDRFPPIAWLEGEWRGYGEFPDRVNFAHKTYEYDLAGMYLVERTEALFPPEEPSTDFEVHQDVTYFYRDSFTGGFRAVGFYVESFVTISTVEVSEDGGRIVVETTDVHNGPPGMRSRSTYTKETDDSFSLLFEVAMPGQDYALYEEIVMERID